MAGKAQEIQILVDELRSITSALESAGEEGRRVLQVLNLGSSRGERARTPITTKQAPIVPAR